MNVSPRQVAEVGEIVMTTPPGRTGRPDPNILAAALVAGWTGCSSWAGPRLPPPWPTAPRPSQGG